MTTVVLGRDDETAMVERALGGTASGGRTVVIGGRAGIGKTTIARAVSDGWPGGVEWCVATGPGHEIPFGATARLLPATLPDPGETAGPRDAAIVRAVVASITTQRDVLVIVDDAHLLDDQSALMTQHLSLAGAAVIMTVRSGEPVPEPIRALWRDGHVTRIDLGPLSADTIVQLCAALLDGPVATQTADRLVAAGDGTPLLVRQLLLDAREADQLDVVDGQWTWTGSIGQGRHVRAVIGDRLANSSPSVRRLLTAVAVAGPLGAPLCRALAGTDAVDDADARELIRFARTDRRTDIEVAHPLVAEGLLADTAPAEIDQIRMDVADAIGATGARRAGDLIVESRLRLAAADPGIAVPTLVAAADRAVQLGSLPVARELADAARTRDGGPVATMVAGEVALLDGDAETAIGLLRAALDGLTCDADIVRAVVDLHHACDIVGDEGTLHEVFAIARTAVADPVWAAVIEGTHAQYDLMHGRTAAASVRGEALLEDFDDPRVRVRLASSVGIGRALGGRTAAAAALVADLFPVALRLQSELPLGPAWVMHAHGIGLLVSGQFREALALVDAIDARAGTTDPWLRLFRGRIQLGRGAVDDAITTLTGALSAIGDDDVAGLRRWARSLLAEACALAGRPDDALSWAQLAIDTPSRTAIYEGDARRAWAWATAAAGRRTAAVDDVVEVADLQHLEGQHGLEIVSLHDAVRLGAGPGIVSRLELILDRVEGNWSGAIAAHVRARRSGDGDDYDRAGDLFAGMDVGVCAAEAYASAARAHSDAGRRTRAAASIRRRDSFLDRAEVPVHSPLLVDLASAVPLTRREIEVVTLARRGLTNRQIAEELFVSVRTVEGHLLRAFAKLGVTDRTELDATANC